MSTVQRCRQCDGALDPEVFGELCSLCERQSGGLSSEASAGRAGLPAASQAGPAVAGGDESKRVLERLVNSNSDDTTILDPNREDPNAADDTLIVVADDIARIRYTFLDASGAIDPQGRIGEYDVIDAIGRGKSGLVLRACSPETRQIVAVKILSPHLASDPLTRKRFLREARLAASIRHECVVKTLAVHDRLPTPYLVMEYVDGDTLQHVIADQGPLGVERIVRIAAQTARGLAAAHCQGVVHRDVKPANILLMADTDSVKLTDFGLARAVGDEVLSSRGTILGTPRYMSPEQARGGDVDHRSDLFSLGGVLYEMCSGRTPFGADAASAVLQRVCEESPTPLATLNPHLPERMIEITNRLLAKCPDERYQSADEVAQLLEALSRDGV